MESMLRFRFRQRCRFEKVPRRARGLGRDLAGLALLALSLPLVGCPSVMKPEPAVRPVPAPGPSGSFGEVGVFVEVEEPAGKERGVSVPLSQDQAVWYQQDSLRLARWQPDEQSYTIVEDSRFDPSTNRLHAEISQGGVYGAFGLSRVPHVRDFQDRLCEGRLGRPDLGRPFPEDLCLVILCPALDHRAWSDAIRGQTGLPVGPEEVGGHFGNLCDRCTGGGHVPPPECGIGREPPPDPIEPPTLEQIPVGIPNGGRAVAVSVDPADDDDIVVASETGGLFTSHDRGSTWTHTSDDGTFDFTDVQHLGSDPSVVVATAKRDTKVDSGGGIWRSTDGGDSWSQVSITPPTSACADDFGAYALDYEPDRDRLWAGTQCGVAFSGDGASWSYLPTAPGYANDQTRAIVAPAAGHVKILTGDRVKVTEDDGGSWMTSATGLPGGVLSRIHNQLAVSPLDHEHLYWAFNFVEGGSWKKGLYRSTDNGTSWSEVVSRGGRNRPPFLRVTGAEGDDYDLYFGDGACWFARSGVAHGSPPSVGSWERLTVDHCDASDVAFANDGRTPLLLASDGGLHETADGGQSWTMTGAGRDGYNALQITEVTGQRHAGGPGNDLYFATQDNDIWGSPDSGASWPNRRCCEGFFLGVPRDPLPASDTRISGVSCAGCMDFVAQPVLTGQGPFPFELSHPEESYGYLAVPEGLIQDAGGTVIGESGSLVRNQPDATSWQTVSLSRSYTDPVVVAQIMTYNGDHPSHVRVRNVGPGSFELKVEEWAYLDGAHTDETVGYAVVEAGRHTLSGGGVLEAGTLTVDHDWTPLSFSAPFAARPAVLSRVQTFAGSDPVVTRHRNTGLNGLDVRLQEEGAKNGTHVTETVGYLAGTASTGLELARGPTPVTHGWNGLTFGSPFSAPPVVLASLETFDGPHTAGLRLRNVSGSGSELKVEDELSVDGVPKLVKHRHYIRHTRTEGENVFHLSTDDGAHWEPRYPIGEQLKGLSQVAGPDADPTVFTPFREPGATPGGERIVRIKRIIGVLGAGSPLVTDVSGIGSLGTFPTMFAWYKPFGVDPDDPNFLIVPDLVDGEIEVTTTGGSGWTPDTDLTDLVTDSGRFRFSWRQFVQVSNIAFDPTCDGHIMVGTRQVGVFQSFDDGGSWQKVAGTEEIPRVSSFYFAGGGEAVLSSYGRGLWRVRYDCLGGGGGAGPPIGRLPDPLIVWRGTQVPLADLDPSSCPRCRFDLTEAGSIVDVETDEEGRVRRVSLDRGRLVRRGARGERGEPPFPVRHGKAAPEELGRRHARLGELLEAGNRVKGLVVEEGRLKGLVVADEDVRPDQLPREEPARARIAVELPSLEGIGAEEVESIVITGRGFDPGHPVAVSLDGRRVKAPARALRVGEDGGFELELRPLLDLGGHTLRVWQETDEGVVEDVATFHVTVQDHPEAEEPEPREPPPDPKQPQAGSAGHETNPRRPPRRGARGLP